MRRPTEQLPNFPSNCFSFGVHSARIAAANISAQPISIRTVSFSCSSQTELNTDSNDSRIEDVLALNILPHCLSDESKAYWMRVPDTASKLLLPAV